MDIHYKIDFFSDWHCGSGLSAGADVDALVIKDDCGLPFIPGKTIKGLVREAMEDLLSYKSFKGEEKEEMYSLFKKTFGFFNGERGEMIKGQAFFTNAELKDDERKAIVADKLQAFMYRRLSSTAIDADGVAKQNSLRRIEVVVPCTLEGRILDVPEGKDGNFRKLMEEALSYIKRLGQNRNRGLGRCAFSIMAITGSEKITEK
ncbi:MAG: CRISPR-associated protein [Muribaculaceae bacterium]|nr:CRISPR-associated protein [Muribaculaceae bacterium]